MSALAEGHVARRADDRHVRATPGAGPPGRRRSPGGPRRWPRGSCRPLPSWGGSRRPAGPRRADARSSSCRGPDRDVTSISPPWAVTISRATYRPRPEARRSMRLTEPRVRLEHGPEVLGRDPRAVVADGDLRVTVDRLDRHVDRSGAGRVLHRVDEEVEEDLFEATGVGPDRDRLGPAVTWIGGALGRTCATSTADSDDGRSGRPRRAASPAGRSGSGRRRGAAR